MPHNDWRGSKQEKLRLYWKVREERKQVVREKYDAAAAAFGKRGTRLWAANEALSFGRGEVRAITEALAITPKTILQGKRELQAQPSPSRDSGRRPSPRGRPKSILEKHPEFAA